MQRNSILCTDSLLELLSVAARISRMVFEQERHQQEVVKNVARFVRDLLPSGEKLVSGPERWRVIDTFCRANDIDSGTAQGLNSLLVKAPWANKRTDIEYILNFGLWLKENVPRNFYGRRDMVYLVDANTPLSSIIENMELNYHYWTSIFGDKLFTTGDEATWRGQILKSDLTLKDYYFSLKGQSGSGTFSVDIAIGHDPRHVNQSTRGEIWRVGMDIEKSPSGERVLRIIRTGSGHKSHGDEARVAELKNVRDTFLDTYKTSPQRLLLFLTLQIAHDLGFNTVKGLSTQGAMEISTLVNSKKPIDYTASLLDVGLTYREGNWHDIQDFQNRFYEIFAANWHDTPTARYDVRGHTALVRAFNTLHDEHGNTLKFKLADKPDDLERAWTAFAKIHETILERERQKRQRSDMNINGK